MNHTSKWNNSHLCVWYLALFLIKRPNGKFTNKKYKNYTKCLSFIIIFESFNFIYGTLFFVETPFHLHFWIKKERIGHSNHYQSPAKMVFEIISLREIASGNCKKDSFFVLVTQGFILLDVFFPLSFIFIFHKTFLPNFFKFHTSFWKAILHHFIAWEHVKDSLLYVLNKDKIGIWINTSVIEASSFPKCS